MSSKRKLSNFLPSNSSSSGDEDTLDEFDLDKYLQSAETQQNNCSALDRKIEPSNKGMQLLLKMGYTEGSGLGVHGSGRTEPIPMLLKEDQLGLGKREVDENFLSNAPQQRPLTSARIARETEEERLKREADVAKKAALTNELQESIRHFHCELCDKGYKNVRQWDEHERSYEHNHKKRFKEMQANQRTAAFNSGDIDRRREKERKREEKEMRRLGVQAVLSGVPSMKPEPSHAKVLGFKTVGKSDPIPGATLGQSIVLHEPLSGVDITKSPSFRRSGCSTLETGSLPISSSANSASPVIDVSSTRRSPTVNEAPAFLSTAETSPLNPVDWRPNLSKSLHPFLDPSSSSHTKWLSLSPTRSHGAQVRTAPISSFTRGAPHFLPSSSKRSPDRHTLPRQSVEDNRREGKETGEEEETLISGLRVAQGGSVLMGPRKIKIGFTSHPG